MVLGRRPYELHTFARKREPGRAKTVIPSGHPQPASYHPTLLPFRLFHAHLVAPLGVRKKRNPTNYLQFSFDCLAIWPPVWSRRRGSNLSCFRLIPFRTATSPDVKIAFPVPAGRSAPPVPLLVHPADGDHPHFHPRGVRTLPPHGLVRIGGSWPASQPQAHDPPGRRTGTRHDPADRSGGGFDRILIRIPCDGDAP